MNHIKSEISGYLAGGLPESRMREIEEHVATCDKCRGALAKAKAKQARVKREALKKASTDPLPNLFLARQGKEIGVDQPASKGPWLMLSVLVLAGAIYGAYRHFFAGSLLRESPAVTSDPSLGLVESTAPTTSPSAGNAAPETAVAAAHEAAEKPEPAPAPVPPPAPIEVKQDWKGTDSGIKTSRIVVIRSEGAWDQLWTDMQNKETQPTVNFGRSVVVCIFGGPRSPNSSIRLGQIHEGEKSVVIPYSISGSEVPETPATPPESSSTTVAAPPAAAPSYPYLLSMIRRVEKRIRVTQREVP
jgi:hypothetical protein